MDWKIISIPLQPIPVSLPPRRPQTQPPLSQEGYQDLEDVYRQQQHEQESNRLHKVSGGRSASVGEVLLTGRLNSVSFNRIAVQILNRIPV